MISFVVAMDLQRVIGKDNALPWHLPADLKYFRNLTMGHTVVMGRKTFESIGKPLPGRKNVIVTRNPHFQAEGCEVIHSVDEIPQDAADEVFVIGGAEIFKALLPRAKRLYLTRILESFAGDTYFPELDETEWQLCSETSGVVDEQNVHAHVYQVYERVLR
ncbi:MAG: dihydrofolate reductase [Tumebacillaceae bacterium]